MGQINNMLQEYWREREFSSISVLKEIDVLYFMSDRVQGSISVTEIPQYYELKREFAVLLKILANNACYHNNESKSGFFIVEKIGAGWKIYEKLNNCEDIRWSELIDWLCNTWVHLYAQKQLYHFLTQISQFVEFENAPEQATWLEYIIDRAH